MPHAFGQRMPSPGCPTTRRRHHCDSSCLQKRQKRFESSRQEQSDLCRPRPSESLPAHPLTISRLPLSGCSSQVTTGEVAAPSRREQSAEVRFGRSRLVLLDSDVQVRAGLLQPLREPPRAAKPLDHRFIASSQAKVQHLVGAWHLVFVAKSAPLAGIDVQGPEARPLHLWLCY